MKFTVNVYDIDKKRNFIFDHEENLATPYEGYETDLDGLKHLLAHKELKVFDVRTGKLITRDNIDEFIVAGTNSRIDDLETTIGDIDTVLNYILNINEESDGL